MVKVLTINDSKHFYNEEITVNEERDNMTLKEGDTIQIYELNYVGNFSGGDDFAYKPSYDKYYNTTIKKLYKEDGYYYAETEDGCKYDFWNCIVKK
jgi:hypothetical protein